MAKRRFSTPTVVMTPGAMGALTTANADPMALVRRHLAGEWNGQPDNAARNEEYLAEGEGMLLSVFVADGATVWVISHIGYGADSYTTILLPDEY
jgi:hypothetical protein